MGLRTLTVLMIQDDGDLRCSVEQLDELKTRTYLGQNHNLTKLGLYNNNNNNSGH